MPKFCVFCGQSPESKNREHVIPRWLIRLTGDEGRQAYLGRRWTTPTLEERRYALSAFTFPACERCNSEFSTLEARAQSVMETIASCGALSAWDWDLFLDWLDKVRIGLWLGMIYLNQNYRDIEPKFHIGTRVGSKDRCVIVYRLEDDGQIGLTWTGTETPLFEYVPSCFTLTVNGFHFVNISFDFLISQRVGFPYPAKISTLPDGRQKIEMTHGLERMGLPFPDHRFATGGTQLWQPMIPWGHLRFDDGTRADVFRYYETEYVQGHCLDFERGRGRVLRRVGNQLVTYPLEPSNSWIPGRRLPRGEAMHRSGMDAGIVLEKLFRYHALSSYSGDVQDAANSALRLHKTILTHFERQRDMYY